VKAALGILLLCLFVAAVASTRISYARYQTVVRLAAPDGEFVIDARPFLPNAAGGSAVAVRYRYRGVDLEAVGYWHPDHPLYAYLRQDSAQVRDLGLSGDEERRGKYSYKARSGPTLYLPPSQFSAAEVDRLADFLRANQDTLRSASQNTTIHGRFFLLLETKAQVHLGGIARLVHAEMPFADYYTSDWLLIVMHHDGKVTLTSTYKGLSHPPETVVWGKMLPPRRKGGRPRLVLDPVTIHESEPRVYDSELMKKWARYLYDKGRRLRRKYEILP